MSRKNTSSRELRRTSTLTGSRPRASTTSTAPSPSSVYSSSRSGRASIRSDDVGDLARHALALARAEPQLDHFSGGVATDEIAGCALGHDTSAVHDHQAIAQLLGLVHVVGRQHQRDPLGLQPVKAVPEGVAGLRVEARGGLVEEQQLGLVDQGPGDRQAPFHPA